MFVGHFLVSYFEFKAIPEVPHLALLTTFTLAISKVAAVINLRKTQDGVDKTEELVPVNSQNCAIGMNLFSQKVKEVPLIGQSITICDIWSSLMTGPPIRKTVRLELVPITSSDVVDSHLVVVAMPAALQFAYVTTVPLSLGIGKMTTVFNLSICATPKMALKKKKNG